MKPFNLEQAKAGANVYTKDGVKVRILCFDSKVDGGRQPIIALLQLTPQREQLVEYYEDGTFFLGVENHNDLIMED